MIARLPEFAAAVLPRYRGHVPHGMARLEVDLVAGQTDADPTDILCVPVFVFHFLARRVKERDVLDTRPAERTSFQNR